MSLCKYKNLFGEPKTGGHSYRIFDIAIVDVIATFALSFVVTLILYAIFKTNFTNTFWITSVLLFILGEILHYVFCVNTTVMKIILGNNNYL